MNREFLDIIQSSIKNNEAFSRDARGYGISPARYKNLGWKGVRFYFVFREDSLSFFAFLRDRKCYFETRPVPVKAEAPEAFREETEELMEAHYQRLREAYGYFYKNRHLYKSVNMNTTCRHKKCSSR